MNIQDKLDALVKAAKAKGMIGDIKVKIAFWTDKLEKGEWIPGTPWNILARQKPYTIAHYNDVMTKQSGVRRMNDLEQHLRSIGFWELEPIGSSSVFLRGNIRFSITRSNGGYFHAGYPGQETYTYIYCDIPLDMSEIDCIIKELEAKEQKNAKRITQAI